MTNVEWLTVPQREPDLGFIYDDGAWQMKPLPDGETARGGVFWNIVPGLSDEDKQKDTPPDLNLIGRWLIKETEPSEGWLLFPYAKLDIERQGREAHSNAIKYSFRLVTMEPVNYEEAPYDLRLVEFKLIAGKDFERNDDDEARFAGKLAVSNFKLGKLTLNEPERWEAGFP
jgi:hypothetical protein